MPRNSSLVPDLTGRIVNNGQYKLVQKLGSGSFGVVYKSVNLRVTDPSASSLALELDACIPDIVAIKVLPIGGKCHCDVQRVRKEVIVHHIASEHEGVVMLYDVFEDDDFVYMVMEFCPGGDLLEQITRRDGRTGEMKFWRNDELVKNVFTQIIDAVDSCHQKRLYHRDLKPENILCNESGSKVYLADFGLATNSPMGAAFGCGTSTYMSPECIGQETNKSAFSNEKSDVWSLGVILLNMITSRSPWRKAVVTDLAYRRFVRDASYLREILPLSFAAVELFRRVLAWDPRVRPTLAQFRRAIHRLDTFWMTDEEIANATTAVKAAAAYSVGTLVTNEQGQKMAAKDSHARRIEEWVVQSKDVPHQDVPTLEPYETALSQRESKIPEVVVCTPLPHHPLARAPPPPQPIPVPEPSPAPARIAAPVSAVRGGHSKWLNIKNMFGLRRTRSPSSTRTPSLSWRTNSPTSSAVQPRTPVQIPGVLEGVNAKISALELGGDESAKGPLRVVNPTPPTSIHANGS